MSHDKIWTPLHVHDMISNGLHYFEVSNKFSEYVQYAVQNSIPSITVTNHGTVANWISNKIEAEKAGLKYIAGEEAYVAMSPDDKSRYHTIILAKNYEGVKTLNQLSSISFQKDHFYYKPRIMFEELQEAISKGNIYVTTACLGSGLAQSYLNGDVKVHHKWLDLIVKNRDNFFLEVQPHLDDKQRKYNKHLSYLADKYDLRMIASNDIHALDIESDKIRKIIKNGKGNSYDEEDDFELWMKTYDEMAAQFKEQGVLTEKQIYSALDFTNVVADSIEEFELDRSHKYPHLYEDPEHEFQKVIKQGYKNRGLDKLPKSEQKEYLTRIQKEYKVYKHNGAIDYMLTDKAMIDAAKEAGIPVSYGRGSVSGSLIAYLTGSTEMDSVKLGLNFERFMNPKRVSLADIDHDWEAKNKEWVQKWLLNNPKWHAASILTLNTYGIKGAVKAIADGLPRYKGKPAYIQSIRNQIGDDGYIPESLYEEHRELFEYAKKVVGVIDSFGRHAAGIIVDTNTIEDTMGTMKVSGWNYPVSQITMKDIEFCGWVKFDVLGLDNIGLISRTAELAGLPFPTPDSDFVDFNDEKVWRSMRDNNIGIFQFESDRAGKILKDLFSDKTINKIKEHNPNLQFIDLLSLGNAAQRPGSASFVDEVIHGEFKDNGHPVLNEFLAPTQGFMVYQEQQIQFLVEFCGYDAAQADVLRRAVGHKIKSVIDEEVPKIHKAFVETMVNKYQDTPEHAEQVAKEFMQVFMDAANYGFSINHSMAYSYIGYISTWLRYYYPLEWCTAAFQIWEGKQDKLNRVVSFAKENGIKLKRFKFGKSKGTYYMDKDTNSIYEGTGSIKGVSATAGDELYLLCDKQNKYFTDLLMDLYDNRTIIIDNSEYTPKRIYNEFSEEQIKQLDLHMKSKSYEYKNTNIATFAGTSRDMINLILLDYFEGFGRPKKLKLVYEKFRKTYKPKNKLFAGKAKKYQECINYEKSLEDTDFSIVETLKNEFALLDRCLTINKDIPANYAFVTRVRDRGSKIMLGLYSIKYGQEINAFLSKGMFRTVRVSKGTLVNIESTSLRPKNVLQDGVWKKSKTDKELWVDHLSNLQ